MKARKVKGLDPGGPLVDNMQRVIEVRIDELFGFIPAALDPANVRELHDMRIAAKRLRYLLELSEPLFGPPAKKGAKEVKALQDVLGEIHDCDELLPLVDGHVAALRVEDAAAVVAGAPADADDLDPALSKDAPNRTRYRGLELLMVHTRARRDLLHTRFVQHWGALEERGFRAELEEALQQVEPPLETPGQAG
jgi:hypothetical protein